MQQLLSLSGQSELFTQLADEVSLSSGQSASKEGSTEFSRALLAGLDAVQKNISASHSETKAKQAESSTKRIAFDDEVVGEPVESPLLDMLEEMRALLQPGKSESDAETKPDTSAENSIAADAQVTVDKLTELLQSLGTDKLSDEQRQQLAEELSGGLSVKEKDVLLSLDIEVVTASADDKSSDAEVALLQKLQRVSELAELALQQNVDADERVVALDDKTQQWLSDQLKELQQRVEPSAQSQIEQSQSPQAQQNTPAASGNILQWLQQQVSDADELSANQKQQLQQWLQQAQVQLGDSSQAERVATAEQKTQQDAKALQLIEGLRQLLAENTAEVKQPARNVEAISTNERQLATDFLASAKLQQDDAKQTQAKPNIMSAQTEAGEPKVTHVAAGAENKAKPRDELSQLAELNGRFKSAENQQDSTNVAQLLDKGIKTSALNGSESISSFSEELINQQAAPMSTQSGSVKASELSSTLQSTMQAIQKPLDPQQAEASQKLQERINIMLSKNIQRADIRLDPPELGQLNVRINMNAEQASVQFQVQSAQARDAVEQALPRLREMLEQQGVALADTDVREQQQQMAGDAEQQHSGGGTAGNSAEATGEHEILLNEGRPLAAGGVDFYV